MQFKYNLVCWLILATAIPLDFVAAANVADFADYSLRDRSGSVLLPGRLYIPPEASAVPISPRPLILFLHGGGQQGTNNISQIVDEDPGFVRLPLEMVALIEGTKATPLTSCIIGAETLTRPQ